LIYHGAMPRQSSPPPKWDEILWKLVLAGAFAVCFFGMAYFRRSLSDGRHGSHSPDHNLSEALITALLAFIISSLFLFRVTRKTDSPKRRALEAAFHGVAGRLAGTITPAHWPTPPRIHFPAEGRSSTLELSPTDSPEGITRVTVDLKGCSPGMLMIFRDDLRSLIPKLFGAQDLEIGDPSFDQRYVVQASPESLARQIFRAGRRAEAMASVSRLDRFPGAAIHLTRESLTVRARGYLNREADLLALARTAIDFTRVILDLEPPAPITWGESTSKGGDCPICGSPLELRVVRCTRCQTPHHLECWKYNGQCSIFGCGELQCTVSP